MRLKESDSQDSLYATEITLSDRDLTDDVTDAIDRMPGLVCVHRVAAAVPLLVMYWRSREHFERQTAELGRLLSCTEAELAPATVRGFVTDYSTPPKPISWFSVIKNVLAIIGALLAGFEAARLLLHHLVEAPEVLIVPGRLGAINYFTDQQLFEAFKITSRIPTEQQVTVDDVSLHWPGSNAVIAHAEFAPQRLKELREDQSETIQFSLSTPPMAGTYEIVASTTAKAGWFRAHGKQSASFPVKVWVPEPTATFKGWDTKKGTTGIATFVLDVGYQAPLGLDCTAVVVSPPSPIEAIIPLMYGSHGASPLARSDDGSTFTQRWITRSFPDFATTKVYIKVQSHDAVEWATLTPLTRKFTFRCSQHSL